MRDRPILFNTAMINVILSDEKTMTRRVIKNVLNDDVSNIKCPYGQIYDNLWVRENWKVHSWDFDNYEMSIEYTADNTVLQRDISEASDDLLNRLWAQSSTDLKKANIGSFDTYEQSPCRSRPPIFMPYWASRIFLEIADIRVEKLQDITEEDAKKEGVFAGAAYPPAHLTDKQILQWQSTHTTATCKEAFQSLWESINGVDSWSVNPPVWVIEFKKNLNSEGVNL